MNDSEDVSTSVEDGPDHFTYICGEPIWNASVSWEKDLPDMGLCMERTVLLWGPCLLLWAVTPAYLFLLRRQGLHYLPWSYLSCTKVAISLFLILVSGTELVWAIILSSQGFLLPINEFLAPAILLSSYVLHLCLVILGRRFGDRSSGLIFCFWTAMLLCGIPQFITTVVTMVYQDDRLHVLLVVTFLLQYIGALVLFVINCIADNPSAWSEKSKNTFPKPYASFLSKITFHWTNKMVWRGFKRSLTTDDIWDLPSGMKAIDLDKKWDEAWEREQSAATRKKTSCDDPTAPPKVSVFRVLFRTLASQFFPATTLYVISELMVFATPRLLNLLIGFTSDETEPTWHGYFYAIILMLSTLLTTFVKNIFYYLAQIMATQLRSTVKSAVYRKALVLSNTSRRESTVGEIVNLMAIDSQRLSDTLLYIHLAWGAPLVISLALYELWQLLGPSVLSGLAVLILLIPVNSYVANKIRIFQTAQMKYKDKRIKLLNEIINGIKVLKLYAWESSFASQVDEIRADEIKVLKKAAYFHAFANFVWLTTPYLVALASFATFLLSSEENILDAKTAFVAISLFNIMRMPIMQLPAAIAQTIQALVAFKRLDKYLGSSNIDLSAVCRDDDEKAAVAVRGGRFSWGVVSEDEPWKLKDIDISVAHKGLVAVVGSVGAGKSSLMSALLGEMEKEAGRVVINGKIAYVSQQAWLQNASLKDNILWGQPFNERKYQKVIEACALKPDIDMLPGGDMTEVGEKGINLSGGQKQRISLARAAYSNASIILLDDPLSAVDAHVGRHIFQNLIGPNGIMNDKTRILVTHAIWVLPQMDEILVMRDGSLVERGTYTELLSQGGNFSQFLLQHINKKEEDIDDEDEDLEEICDQLEETPSGQALLRQLSRQNSKAEDGRLESLRRRRRNSSTCSSRRQSESENETNLLNKGQRRDTIPLNEIKSDDAKKNGQILIQEEKVEVGKVKWKVYQFYGQSIGALAASLPIIFYSIAQISQAGSNVWLSQYSSASDIITNETIAEFDRTGFLLGYGGFGIGQSLFFYFGSLVTWTGTLLAGKNIHKRLLANVLHLPMSFFDTNPSGRIMNRMSKEMDVLDSILPVVISAGFSCFAQVATTLVVIIASTPIVMIVILPVMVAYYYIQKVYICAARQLKRIESQAKSPIFSYFSESLQGVSVIRAFKKQDDFTAECQGRIDVAAKAFVTNLSTNRWLLVRLECLGNLITFAAALFAVAGRETIQPGIVGLSITYALNVTVILNWLVRMTAEIEANIVSVERIREYIEEEQEAPWEVERYDPLKSWPQQGCITFSDYQARYRPGLELVVKGISFEIKAGEKIGIIGRTGAGKSSLTLSLFRIIEGAGGSIDVDGVDISKIGLHVLRGRLSIIPQDPVLFSGTLRINLDPFGKYTDAEVWQALENAHLKDYASALTNALQATVEEGGSNLSVGQRQLVCLARALLRKSKILVLDEATAAVDLQTDDLIQATIRKEFADCTILTIAHRLNNIMDSDKILVMDKGKLAEFSTPTELLAKKDSIFYGMAKDSGLV